MRPFSRRHTPAFTIIELLIGVVIVGTLTAIAIPGYFRFIQGAREAAVIAFLRQVHKGQQLWRMETDAPGYTGDFDELEQTGYIPGGENAVQFRRLRAANILTLENSSRNLQGYRLDLRAINVPTYGMYVYSINAYPANRSQSVRWFYIDQTGVIRADKGTVGSTSPPAT